MKKSRITTLLLGLGVAVLYGILTMLIVRAADKNVSITYVFVLPVVLGAIPVLFSTKEQLSNYKTYLLFPWVVVLTLFF
ncbi:MAG: hypothetical protein V4543_15840 [Bacteroidota bacterium]